MNSYMHTRRWPTAYQCFNYINTHYVLILACSVAIHPGPVTKIPWIVQVQSNCSHSPLTMYAYAHVRQWFNLGHVAENRRPSSQIQPPRTLHDHGSRFLNAISLHAVSKQTSFRYFDTLQRWHTTSLTHYIIASLKHYATTRHTDTVQHWHTTSL
jgi:hypothetical protein